ncbi:MAG: NAD(P)/FAD-dependent oxidoreductase [Halobacteriales archaeon]
MTEDIETLEYEVVVVGGGPAGLSAALYTTRLGHRTALVDRGGGRAAMMQDTHNVVGVTEDVSGQEYLATGVQQLEDYGCDVHRDVVSRGEKTDVEEEPDGGGVFRLSGGSTDYYAERVVLATGMNDVRPEPPLPRTGRGLHYCLHCDAHMFVDEPVYVMGHGDSAGYVAMIMLNFTDEVDVLLRGETPEWSRDVEEMIANHPVEVVEEDVVGVRNDEEGWLESMEFEDGVVREYRGGFAMYGSDYNNELALQLGCDVDEDGAVEVEDHGRTNVEGVYAVGDLTPGHNQIPIALAEGAEAGISIHFDLRDFPRSVEEIREKGAVTSDEVPAVPDDVLRHAAEFHTY